MERCLRIAMALAALSASGCTHGPGWPKAPLEGYRTPESSSATWVLDGAEGPRYLQSFRGGVKRALYYDAENDGQFELLADLDQLDARRIRHVFILIDGVPYRLFKELYDEGHFRLFYPPGKMIAPFPSLTDISYGNVFEASGTSCYESAIYDPDANRLKDGTDVHLTGRNELWASAVDYRQAMWVDGVSYLWPAYSARREFAAMFRRADQVLRGRPDRQDVLIYSLSTDAACHGLGWAKARQVLIDLDRYIERLMFDSGGQIGVVLMADHGNNFVADCRKVDVDGALRSAGMTPVHERGFRRKGDVVVPRYGLISLVGMFCQSQEDRERLVEVLLETPGVEHVMWRSGERAFVATRDGRAEIGCHVAAEQAGSREFFSYIPTQGDPLGLLPLLKDLPTHRFGEVAADYYSASDLLEATADHVWPDPLWRIWHGLGDQTAVAPDLAVSLAPGWYYGSLGLDFFATLHGTHGGLRDVDSDTFFTSTMFSPPARMRTVDVAPVIRRHFPWTPPTKPPSCRGLDPYFQKKDAPPPRRHLP